jgi:hypothetical protein
MIPCFLHNFTLAGPFINSVSHTDDFLLEEWGLAYYMLGLGRHEPWTRALTVDKWVHGGVDQILDHVVAPRVPVWCVALLGPQFVEGRPQTQAELVAHGRVGLDGGVLSHIESEDQTRFLEFSSLAPQLGDAL